MIDDWSEFIPEDDRLADSAVEGEPGKGVGHLPGAHHRIKNGLEFASLDGGGDIGQRLYESGGRSGTGS